MVQTLDIGAVEMKGCLALIENYIRNVGAHCTLQVVHVHLDCES